MSALIPYGMDSLGRMVHVEDVPRDNLKVAWLLGDMVREPGEFEQVGFEPVDALQHALFMIGYAMLLDTAVSAA